MPRDVNGVYTLPLPPRTNGAPNVIGSAWANTTFNDIAAALTASVSIPGSVTPAHLSNDQAGFQQKMGLDVVMAELADRLDYLESCDEAEIGDMEPFPLAAAPEHYLVCDGAAVSRTTYAALFAVISTTFGAGDGSTTFNLPDLRGEWLKGAHSGLLVGANEAPQVGTHTHSATTASDGAHSHTATVAADGSHTHGATVSAAGSHTHTMTGGTEFAGEHTHYWEATLAAAGNHSHAFGSQVAEARSSGGIQVFPSIGGGSTYFPTQPAGNHAHTISGSTSYTTGSYHLHAMNGTTTSVSAGAEHQHAVEVYAAGAHSHSFNTTVNGAHAHTITVDALGSEGRVRNVAMQYCIRYEEG